MHQLGHILKSFTSSKKRFLTCDHKGIVQYTWTEVKCTLQCKMFQLESLKKLYRVVVRHFKDVYNANFWVLIKKSTFINKELVWSCLYMVLTVITSLLP